MHTQHKLTAHESGNNPVEDASLITETLLASAKSLEIFASSGRGGSVHAHLNAPSRLAIDADVEVDRVGNVRSLLAKKSREETTDHLKLGAGAGGRCNISRANEGKRLGANGGERLRHLCTDEEGGSNEGSK